MYRRPALENSRDHVEADATRDSVHVVSDHDLTLQERFMSQVEDRVRRGELERTVADLILYRHRPKGTSLLQDFGVDYELESRLGEVPEI